jgi:hypothetical protein
VQVGGSQTGRTGGHRTPAGKTSVQTGSD